MFSVYLNSLQLYNKIHLIQFLICPQFRYWSSILHQCTVTENQLCFLLFLGVRLFM